MKHEKKGEAGFTLVELTVSLFLLAALTISFFGLFISLVNSTVVAKRKAAANALAINQMEYLKSLPYDALAVQGGSIITASPIPAVLEKKVNNAWYKVKTSISYVDDAYDGCGPYPNLETKKKYCRNYPPPSSAPATDTNPADYKDLNVTVTDRGGKRLAFVDTQVSARVAETASATGALFVSIYDPSGTGVSGATVSVKNTTTSPVVQVSDDTDGNGMAIFYGLPPDPGQDYVISVSKDGYSSLTTLGRNWSAPIPMYPNQRIVSQQASNVSLIIAPLATHSLVVETTDTSGTPLGGVSVHIKGGYKMYASDSNTMYYYDNMAPNDIRPITNAAGLVGVNELAPVGKYIFCGDDGAGGCKVGWTSYYLAAALPYSGTKSLQPITIPIADPATPPAYTHEGNAYQQKVRLMLTTNSNYPRVFEITPDYVNKSTNLSNVKIVISGKNLSGATMGLKQGTIVLTPKTCSRSDTSLNCNFDMTSLQEGDVEVSVTNGSGTLTLPVTPLGGMHVRP